jgi:hypothetical protein
MAAEAVGDNSPVVAKISLFFKMKIYAELAPQLESSQTIAPRTAHDVGTKCIAPEQVLEGHGWRQRLWRTIFMAVMFPEKSWQKSKRSDLVL